MKAKGIAQLGTALILILAHNNSQAALVSDLLITEVMPDPSAVSDSNGEWFELFNPTDEIIDLDGIILRDDGSNEYHFDGPLPISPGAYFVLGRNADPLSNGGFIPNHVYNNFSLGNSGDEIIFSNGLIDLLRLDYGNSFDAPGRSRELVALPMISANYQLTMATLSYGLGDIGTPGRAGTYHPALSAVPLPPTAWLFLSGLLVVLFGDLRFLIGRVRLIEA